MADNENNRKKQQPEWLDSFLQKTFFQSCSVHPIRRNDLNKYCINCESSACQYCISSGSHRQHKILKIYRHVYKDVVSLSSIEKYIDCSRIQPYKSNKRLVMALNPLPHSGPTTSNGKTSCEICKRRLSDPDLYDYCSISCKVMAFSRKTNDQEPSHLSVQAPTKEKQSEASQPSKARRRRKGKPQRAPFF